MGGMTIVSSVPGTLAWWKMDEGAGPDAFDSSGNARTLLLTDMGWGAGKIGGAIVLNGVSSLGAWVGNMSNGLRAITVCGWAFSSLTDSSFIFDGANMFILHFGGAGFYLTADDAAASGYLGWDVKPATGGWHHLAGTWDGATMKIYLDGVKQSSELAFAGGANNKLGLGTQTFIGNTFNIPQPYFQGSIDDVRIFGVALSAKQIMDIFTLRA